MLFPNLSKAQVSVPKFGKGLQIMAQDSSFYMRIGFRFQTLFSSGWSIEEEQNNLFVENNEAAASIRRSRLKFDGWTLTPKLKYKVELSLSNRDNGGGNSSRFSNAANIILDASIKYNFYKTLSVWVGQGKYPGNRERIVSSGNLQFVDRSRLNARFTIDRDVGIMLKNKTYLSDEFLLRQTIAIGTGEGKNITSGNIGGHAYTAKLEALPFGEFASNGDYSGSDIIRESKPKLAVAVAYDVNYNAGRTRGQTGSFIPDGNDNPFGKNLKSFFADLMFKYNGLSVMAEYANRSTEDGNPFVVTDTGETIATYYTGSALNVSVGKMLTETFEIAARFTDVKPDEGVESPENQYTIGASKYIVGHKLKVQTDFTFRDIEVGADDVSFRLQIDIHF